MNGKLERKTGAGKLCTECGFYCNDKMKPFKSLIPGNGIIRFTLSKKHSGYLVEKGLCREGTKRRTANE